MNLLYFAARPWFYGPDRAAERKLREEEERAVGITHVRHRRAKPDLGLGGVGVGLLGAAEEARRRLDVAEFERRLAGANQRIIISRRTGKDANVARQRRPRRFGGGLCNCGGGGDNGSGGN